MSRRVTRSASRSRRVEGSSLDSEEFVLVSPRGSAGAEGQPEAEAEPSLDPHPDRIKGTPEQEAAYEQALKDARKAEMMGIQLPPVVPPGHRLVAREEPSKPTFWNLLLRRAENRGALQQLYLTTLLMVVVPFGLMSLSYYLLFPHLSNDDRLLWSGVGGVVGVNLVALGFGIFAYLDRGTDEEQEEERLDPAQEAEAKRKKWEEWEKEKEEQESREDRERLRSLREKHQKKKEEEQQAAASAASSSSSAETETVSTPSRLRQRRAKDSALAADAPELDTPSHRTRSRSRSMAKRS